MIPNPVIQGGALVANTLGEMLAVKEADEVQAEDRDVVREAERAAVLAQRMNDPSANRLKRRAERMGRRARTKRVKQAFEELPFNDD